jgi:DNA polymerase III epsilon subunit-like protein
MIKTFIALDLELNQPSGKIIQVGVCAGGRLQSEEEYRIKSWYLDPGEPIAPEIVALTGIDDQLIAEQAKPHAQVAAELSAFILENDCFVNPVTWGGGDSVELLDEFRQRDIRFPHFGRRWVDVKTVYSFLQMAKGVNPAGGLSSAMGRTKLQFIGPAHRAEVDAFNTLRFWFHLMERQTSVDAMLTLAKNLS